VYRWGVFSRRLDWGLGENALAALEAEKRAAGADILDLTESNPTRVGLTYPTAAILKAIAQPGVMHYQPDPRGLPEARAAVAADYARRGADVHADDIVITASSSESYGLLFKVLCDPGDAVLVPEPSYPLFEHLARLEGVQPVGYRLAHERASDGDWPLDFDSIERAAATGRVRAIVVVHPNNPTGSFIGRGELARLVALCAERSLALISDEVFADYGAEADISHGAATSERVGTIAGAASSALTFSLGGLSKSCGLPQLKLGWIAAAGPGALVQAGLARLTFAADAMLSVATAVQRGLPELLAAGAGIRRSIQERVAANRAALIRALPASSPCTLLRSEGGWSAILRVPAVCSDEAWALELLRADDVLCHPGYFFDMPGPGAYLVLSLLPEPARFHRAVARVVGRCGGARVVDAVSR